MSKKDKEGVEAFYVGVICALIVVVDSGYESIAREVLDCCADDKIIRRIAKREGDDSVVKLIDDYRRDKRMYAQPH